MLIGLRAVRGPNTDQTQLATSSVHCAMVEYILDSDCVVCEIVEKQSDVVVLTSK